MCIAISTWWQVISPLAIIITILATAPTRQPGSFVFSYFNNETGWASTGYVVLVGLLQAQFTLTGYDSSAHMSEETKNAEIAGPVGLVMAIAGKWTWQLFRLIRWISLKIFVAVSAVMGWIFIIGFLFCIQDLDATIESSTGFPVMQIMFDCAGRQGGIVLMVMLILACWFCGFASVTVCIYSREWWDTRLIWFSLSLIPSINFPKGELAHDLCIFKRWCHSRKQVLAQSSQRSWGIESSAA